MLPKAHFATLYAKPAGRPFVDTCVKEFKQNKWIFFPWDIDYRFAKPIRDGGRAGGADRAVETVARIVENVDVLVGNEEDLQKGLGIEGPKVAAKSKLDPSAFIDMMGRVVSRFPAMKAVATTLREVHSTSRHSWAAVAWIDGKTHLTPTLELDVLDRVGGGDGFGSGFFYGLMSGAEPEEAVRFGWAHGALLTTYPGDTTMATVEQVRALARGGSARIQR